MRRPFTVFDLDGTLVQSSPWWAYDNDDVATLAKAQPIPHVVAYARRLDAEGVPLAIATSRCRHSRAGTDANLRAIGLYPLPAMHRVDHKFNLAHAVRFKADVLRALGADLIVGDRDDLEGAAAKLAGVRFQHVRDIPALPVAENQQNATG